MNLLGSNTFPQIEIYHGGPDVGYGLQFGPSTSFGNAGMFQNQWEAESSLNWVKGRHTIAFGGAMGPHAAQHHQQQHQHGRRRNSSSFLNFVEGSVI